MESTYPSRLTVPAQVHEGEDEMPYVLAGELRGFCGDERWSAGPGGFVFVPRDRPHSFVVTSDESAGALVVVGPARLDGRVAASGVRVAPPSDGRPA